MKYRIENTMMRARISFTDAPTLAHPSKPAPIRPIEATFTDSNGVVEASILGVPTMPAKGVVSSLTGITYRSVDGDMPEWLRVIASQVLW